MERYETRLEGGRIYLETSEERIEVGELEDVVSELGETFEIEYDEHQRTVPWLETDEGTLTINVRETLPTLSFDDEFVGLVVDAPLEGSSENGEMPPRTAVFTDLLRKIWESKGNLEEL